MHRFMLFTNNMVCSMSVFLKWDSTWCDCTVFCTQIYTPSRIVQHPEEGKNCLNVNERFHMCVHIAQYENSRGTAQTDKQYACIHKNDPLNMFVILSLKKKNMAKVNEREREKDWKDSLRRESQRIFGWYNDKTSAWVEKEKKTWKKQSIAKGTICALNFNTILLLLFSNFGLHFFRLFSYSSCSVSNFCDSMCCSLFIQKLLSSVRMICNSISSNCVNSKIGMMMI